MAGEISCSLGCFNDLGLDSGKSFLSRIYQKRVPHDLEDSELWMMTKCEKFSIKVIYDALELSEVPFPRIIIWSPRIGAKFISFQLSWFLYAQEMQKGLRGNSNIFWIVWK